MKILHYGLGFPPYRSGGLTKFCIDIMLHQKKEGHNVALLWPGKISFFYNKTQIKYRGHVDGIESWEIINPTPVPYDEGIEDIGLFINQGEEKCYYDFLEQIKPDVIHIHTFMGIHKNFVIAAHKRKIRIVFTVHDYFTICPKVTMFRNGRVCDCVHNCEKCPECNTTALSIWKIKLLQSPLYRKIKNSAVIKRLRKNHRDNYLSDSIDKHLKKNIKTKVSDYIQLRNHYESILNYIDVIHYNSNLSKDRFEEVFGVRNFVTIPITHKDIKDNRRIKNFSDNYLKISYLGPYGDAKGFYILKEALDDLWRERQNFCLNIFFDFEGKPPYIKSNERYSYDQLENIFDNTDVLIVPSKLYESFGYTALEALSYGVPVIVTKNVGAKDIIPEGAGFVVNEITAEDIKQAIECLTPANLESMNNAIMKSASIMDINTMHQEFFNKLYC